MAARSAIEWTDASVNFWWGCTEVGPGCQHCYARALDARFGGGVHWGVGAPRRKIKGAAALLHRLDNGYSEWAADAFCRRENARAFGLAVPNVGDRRRVFIQSMSDLFDLEVPIEWFAEGWQLIETCDRLAIQIVTKRVSAVEKRLTAIGRTIWPQHAGLIVTVVNQDEADRDIPRLLALKARLGIPWVGLSIEPMLGPIDLRQIRIAAEPHAQTHDALSGHSSDTPWGYIATKRQDPFGRGRVDWVIAGGESGPHARPMHPDWARSLRDQCAAAGVPFFFKQWGEWREAQADDEFDTSKGRLNKPPAFIVNPCDGTVHCFLPPDADPRCRAMIKVGKRAAGRLLDGREHNDMPKAIA